MPPYNAIQPRIKKIELFQNNHVESRSQPPPKIMYRIIQILKILEKAELFPFETFMTLILTNNRKTQHSSKSKGVIITCFENPEVWLVFIKIG